MASTKKAAEEAAEILHRVVELLPFPAGVASYLRGYADGLAAPRRAGSRSSRGGSRPAQ